MNIFFQGDMYVLLHINVKRIKCWLHVCNCTILSFYISLFVCIFYKALRGVGREEKSSEKVCRDEKSLGSTVLVEK